MASDLRNSRGVTESGQALPALAAQASPAKLLKVVGSQALLFGRSPRSVCEELGMNWWSACKLFEERWISFPPETTPALDEAQEAELRFIGALVVAGCDEGMLTSMLQHLTRPYAYDLRNVYFDWSMRTWRMLPDQQSDPEAAYSDWVKLLVQSGDTETLKGILELAGDALARVHSRTPEQEFYAFPQGWHGLTDPQTSSK